MRNTESPNDEFMKTAKLRRACREARTRPDWLDAKAALVADLKTKFSGIDAKATGNDADKHGKLFSHLMMEWNPILASPADLKAIAGAPTSKTPTELHYNFDNGIDGSYWQFKVEDETIVGITYTLGD